MATWGIILAAGSGTRLATATGGAPKQFLLWKGRPLYWHSAMAMSRCGSIDGLIFVFPDAVIAEEQARIRALAFEDDLGLPWQVTAGGQTRQESSAAGVLALPSDCDRVLIHDAARCFASPGLFRRICDRLSPTCPGVIPAVPLADTIKLAREDNPGLIARTLPRHLLHAAQTPQGFMVLELKKTQAAAGCAITDDASLLEQAGYEVQMIAGEPGNIKITRPEDLMLLGSEVPVPCTGFGYDAHRYGVGRPLKLGGVFIPGDLQVVAHSDGDVLLHSLMDALLGCACLGDIGRHFPDSDSRYEGISSAILLDHVVGLLAAEKISPVHIDMTVVAQKPRLAPYGEAIRKNVATLVRLSVQAVNFKATSEEKMGFTGRLEGIKAFTVVTALRNK